MRKIILLTSLLAQTTIFALSCPNNGRILNFNDPIKEVLAACGPATASRNYINTIIMSAEWVYYLPNTTNNSNTKLTILFNHEHVANISVALSGANEQNLQSFGLCRLPIQIGSDMNTVKAACGQPMAQQTFETTSITMTELSYEGIKPNTLRFANDHLQSWE